ncbi:MAG: methionine--tRNA ligase subunit beta [Euryarchaeota archaeon]|nr:methionine--tRNA ligase subunit beta [Euryarchaeota archaeon]
MQDMVSLEDFEKLELRVGVIKRVEEIEGSRKLLRLVVDTGEERQLVAGIKGSYTPEELTGKRVVVLANLHPKKLMGVLSQGMLLAAQDGERIALLTAQGRAGERVH